MKFLFTILLLATFQLHAAEEKLPNYLYSLPEKFTEVKDSRYLRDRMYTHYFPEFKTWGYVMSTPDGKLPSPLEALGESSVVSGQILGAKDPFQNYILAESGNWEPTKEPEKWILWTASKNIDHRMETFVPVSQVLKYAIK